MHLSYGQLASPPTLAFDPSIGNKRVSDEMSEVAVVVNVLRQEASARQAFGEFHRRPTAFNASSGRPDTRIAVYVC